MVMHPRTVEAFVDEIEKIAASPALIGAGIGAGASGVLGGLKEWDRRLDEDRSNVGPDQSRKLRTKRLKRLAAGMALGAGAGAVGGHYAGKGVKALTGELKGVSEHAANTLSKGFSGGLQEGSKGVFWNMFKRRK
jgi:hypothetical protein